MSFGTSWNDWTTDCGARPTPLDARGGDVYFIVHHAVNRVVQDTIALSKPGGRQVSMSFAIGPTAPGVTSPVYCVGVVPESRWPYTTSSSLDKAALTAEVSNINLTASYPVAQEAKEWLARIAAYMHLTYGMPLDRVHVLSHQEVYARGYGSYPTACPGPDLQATMDWIVARAIELVSPPKEIAMTDRIYILLALPGKPVQYGLISPSEIEGGVLITTSEAEAEAYSILTQQGSTGAWGCKTQAQWDQCIALGRRLHQEYVRIHAAKFDGEITVAPDPALLDAQKDTTAAVKALGPKIDATTTAVKKLNPPD